MDTLSAKYKVAIYPKIRKNKKNRKACPDLASQLDVCPASKLKDLSVSLGSWLKLTATTCSPFPYCETAP